MTFFGDHMPHLYVDWSFIVSLIYVFFVGLWQPASNPSYVYVCCFCIAISRSWRVAKRSGDALHLSVNP